jgi:hypothetical protein
MSQVTHPRISLPTHVRTGRTVLLGALLALAASTAVVLILALGNESPDTAAPVSAQAEPSLRSDGGPEETSVAAAVGQRAIGPDEAGIAASIGGTSPKAATGPDESRTAAAVGGNTAPGPSGPDESHTAASISGR